MNGGVVVQRMVRAADAVIARGYLALFRERSAVLAFLFHALFEDDGEAGLNHIDPLQRITVAQFRQFVRYYLRHGYRFVTPADLSKGLEPGGRYALVTFDDGYANNARALPVLGECRVPATFFVCTENVLRNKCFWWDVLYRERAARGASAARVYAEGLALKRLPTERIEAELSRRFGADAFTPRGDLDRPFSAGELREFARSPYVHVGNHTANHAILTNYEPEQARAQVASAQESLREITGVTPMAIAYPNGAHDRRVMRVCEEVGLQVGFTMRPEKIRITPAGGASNPSGASPSGLLRLGRFAPRADVPMDSQCRTYRSDVQLYGRFRDTYLRLGRGQPGQ